MNFFKNLISKSNGNVFVIAEACDNHMGSYDIATALVDAAKYSGADAVKFQHHLAYEEMLKESPMSDNFTEPLYDFLQRNSLTLENHKKLKKYCDDKDIIYLCTPFSYKAALEVKDLVPFFKIGSGEFQDHWFIDRLKEINKPVLFSSGMCTWDELVLNIKHLEKLNFDFAIMNCLSEYPPNYQDMNLGLIKILKNEFPCIEIGHSDHSPDISTSIVATAYGAGIIEKHLTISEFIPGPDKSVSINPQLFKQLVTSLRYIKSTLGESKIINKKEEEIRTWAYRSVVSTNELEAGKIISKKDICTKRPGTGVLSIDYKKIIGKKVKNKILKNQFIKLEDLNG